MDITISSITTTTIDLSTEERAACRMVDDVLTRIMDYLPDNTIMTSMYTGEVVETNEIPRVRGVLDALLRQHCFKIDERPVD